MNATDTDQYNLREAEIEEPQNKGDEKMNYGYDKTGNDVELAEKIQTYLDTIPEDNRGQKPYIEINGLYDGVRIRRLTHYSDEMITKIVNVCNAIYETFIK